MCGNQPLPAGTCYAVLYNFPLQVHNGRVNDGLEVACFRVLHVCLAWVQLICKGESIWSDCVSTKKFVSVWPGLLRPTSIRPGLFCFGPGSVCGLAQPVQFLPRFHVWSGLAIPSWLRFRVWPGPVSAPSSHPAPAHDATCPLDRLSLVPPLVSLD